MKTYITKKQLNGIFSIVFLLFVSVVNAEIVDHIFEKTIEVPKEITVKTDGMELPRMDFSGWVSSSNEKGFYTLKTREELFLKVDKRFNVHTWDRAQIKHIVKVTVRAESASVEQQFLKDLRHELNRNAADVVELTNMLGIKSIMMKNGWLRGISNTVITSEGDSYKLNYLEISAEVYIPETANVEIRNAHFTDFYFGELKGKLNVELEGGKIEGTFFEDISARLNSSELRVETVDQLSISAHRCKVYVSKVEECFLGNLPFEFQNFNLNAFNPGPVNPVFENSDKDHHNSSLNKYKLDYIKHLSIENSANDDIDIIQLNNLKIRNTDFSEIAILNLSGSLIGGLSFGTLDIMAFEPSRIRNFNFESFRGSVNLYGNNLPSMAINLITNKVESEVELNSQSGWLKSEQHALKNVKHTNYRLANEYVLQKTKVNNKSTNMNVYLKGTASVNAEEFNIYCNGCDLTIH